MKIQDQMQRFLDDSPNLEVAAFGDLSSGLILSSASSTLVPREVLNLLGEKAAECMAFLGRQHLAPAGGSADIGNSIIHFTEEKCEVFARGSAASNDVICAVCDGSAGLKPLMRKALALSNQIAGPE
ncbi:MAG: hypothetical protein ABI832_08775 [bacterium]